MTETEFKLKKCFENTIWMAIRYANGRHTYAPYIVRDAVKTYRELYPEWNLQIDEVIIREYEDYKNNPESNLDLPGFPKEDWLIDLFQTDKDTGLYDPQ